MTAIEKLSLSNGMEVVFVPTPELDVVALQGWIRFGSADEPEAVAGIAHLFEHLLFKGTNKRGVGEIAREIESLGGDVNAFTTYDCTVMHLTLSRENWKNGIEILADALGNSIVDADEYTREREVILEEIKRRNDNPGSVAGDLLRKHLFGTHPYARPVIGYSNVVAKISRDEVMSVYKKYYNASNIYLTIAGNISTDELVSTLEKNFASFKKGELSPARKGTRPSGFSSEYIHHTCQDAHLSLAWRVPPLTDFATPALDALALILGQGESSRLYQRLVLDTKLLRSVGSYSWSPKEIGAFEIHFKAPPGIYKNFAKILEITNACFEEPISLAELEKVKTNLIAQNAYSKESVDGLAERFGYVQALSGDANFDFEYSKRLEALETDDIEAVRKNFLTWDSVVATGIVPDNDKLPIFKAPKAAAKPVPKKSTQGVESHKIGDTTVLVKRLRHAPIFSMKWNALGGARMEKAPEAGLGNLWTQVVCEGARDSSGKIWSQKEINSLVDFLGASIGSSHGKSSSGLNADGLTKDFEKLISLLIATQHEPLFEKSTVDAEKKRSLQDLRSAQDSATAILSQLFNSYMFPKHPYGRSRFDDVKRIPKFTAAQLMKAHRNIFSQRQVISVVGDMDPEKVFRFLERELPQKKKLSQALLKKQKIPYKATPSPIVVNVKKEQSHIQMGFPGIDIAHKDRWALSGLSGLLSGQGGRLFLELRDKLSLCYSVGCSHFEGIDGGYFAFYIGTSPEKEEIAMKAFRGEITKLLDKGIPDQEWKHVQRYLLGNKKIEDQRFSPQALELSLTELYGLGFEESFLYEKSISELKASDVHEAAKKYLGDFDKAVITIVRPKT